MEMKQKIKNMRDHNPFISNTEIAYSVILEGILDGDLSCGKKLNQEEMASALGMSRTPVREALILLEKEGFVLKEKGSHYSVYRLALKDYLSFSNFRKCLEGYAASNAAENATSNELTQLEKNIALMVEAEKQENFPEFLFRDEEFHQLVVSATKNKYLMDTYEQYKNKLIFYRKILIYPDILQFTCKQHEHIFHWISERNCDKARQTMENHVAANMNLVVLTCGQE